jgi:hypothetical protein
MADDPGTHRGWLPPNAPGAQPPPRFDAVPPPPPPAPAPAPPAPGWSPPGADSRAQAGAPPAPGRPTFTREQAPGQRNTIAAWALGLGIAGLALLLVSFGTLFLITLPCSIAALMLGRKAQGMAERGELAAGQGQVTAALWLGRIGVIAGVAALVVFVALVVSGFDFEQFRDDLQRELDQQRRQDQGGGSGVRSAVEGLRAVIGR